MPARFDPDLHHRRSIRLKGYDYSQAGAYFVTIVAHQRTCLFGSVVDGGMVLNGAGRIIERAWFDLPKHYHRLELSAFIVMPNHMHGIIILHEDERSMVDARRGGSVARNVPLPEGNASGTAVLARNVETRPYKAVRRHPLSEIVRAFKSFSARRINALRHVPGAPVWQRNYYEHIIRNERQMEKIWLYVESNPFTWAEDDENPARTAPLEP